MGQRINGPHLKVKKVKELRMNDMTQPETDHENCVEAFIASACAGKIGAIRPQVAAGFDLNGTDRFGDTILERVIGDLEFCPQTPKYMVVKELLRLGADSNARSRDGSSPLIVAVLHMDTEMLRLLLDAGADPNAVPMHASDELLYDWAVFVYRYEVWNVKLPETAKVADQVDPDAWLCYLDRLAVKYGKRRPDYLRLLRNRGALSITELRQGRVSGGRYTPGQQTRRHVAPRVCEPVPADSLAKQVH
ncbi:MAG: ankyrin repeat domain-containing protein [Candidatus Accumulibacter sp.]|uniref:ankyrin repeat domain-containing protein n=1 Tax=Accumulibacter sp. TaxID=2053492 RepID=UPI001AC8527A|nr:ankyrin repeat domain-containing protein [Accumulibacter sp.]MBN8517859.1 ankyrin repeat domain-containing protein [Accumulibacter sp.]